MSTFSQLHDFVNFMDFVDFNL